MLYFFLQFVFAFVFVHLHALAPLVLKHIGVLQVDRKTSDAVSLRAEINIMAMIMLMVMVKVMVMTMLNIEDHLEHEELHIAGRKSSRVLLQVLRRIIRIKISMKKTSLGRNLESMNKLF